MIGLSVTIAELLNARNTLEVSGISGSSQTLASDNENETPVPCDGQEDLVWNEETQTCITQITTPENPDLQLTPSN